MATNLKQVADQLMADIMDKIQNGEYEVTFAGDLNCWLTVDGIKDVHVQFDGTLEVPLKIDKEAEVVDIFDKLQDEILHEHLKRTTEEKERIERAIEKRKQLKEQQGDH